jgi:two-component system, cell cycle sensor histidine kinase and response regulator CckA
MPAGTILLAEDVEPLREMIREMLQAAVYTVLEAKSAPEAVRIVQQHSGRIDLLLTDVMMPGMSGPELVETLRALKPGLKVLVMSGAVDQAMVPDAEFIQKPFTGATLLEKVVAAIGR